MKIVSWNVDGLRAVYQKGVSGPQNASCKKDFLTWLEETDADVVCFQEVKAQKEQLPADLLRIKNYHAYFNCGNKKGFGGVAVYIKEKPENVKKEIGLERFDEEGRALILEFPHLVLMNLYLPQGGRQKENLEYKLEVYESLLQYLDKIKHKKVILIGDFNIAHKEIDLERPKQNHKNTMFTDEEREKLNRLVEMGFVDTFRNIYTEGGFYSWWPFFKNARERNLGWRIDYAFVSTPLKSSLKEAFILKEVFGSDHCPVGIDIDF